MNGYKEADRLLRLALPVIEAAERVSDYATTPLRNDQLETAILQLRDALWTWDELSEVEMAPTRTAPLKALEAFLEVDSTEAFDQACAEARRVLALFTEYRQRGWQ